MSPSSFATGVPAEPHPAARPRLGYLSPKDASAFTGISYQELERLRAQGGGPLFCRVTSRKVRYAVEDLCAWLDSYKVANNSEAIIREQVARKGAGRT